MSKEWAAEAFYGMEGNAVIEPQSIPADLKRLHQWICWRYVSRSPDKKPDKQPVNPNNLHNAGVHWPNTWSSFAQAYTIYSRRQLDGIGFVLTRADPFVGVDLDNCVTEEGIRPAAQEMVAYLGSYTEISPSGHGLRILLTCTNLLENRRTRTVEVYSHSRYLTITGHHIPDTPTAIRQYQAEDLNELLRPALESQRVETPRAPAHHSEQMNTTDMELWDKIFAHDRYGHHHRQRFFGDTSLDGGDHSFTVIRLLNCLARWTQGDPYKMRSMMLLSPLANDKWLSRRGSSDWLDHQIADAIAYVSGGRKR